MAQTKGAKPVDLTVGNTTKLSAFFVVDGTAAYNALLGRDWIHSNRLKSPLLASSILSVLE